MLSRPKRHAVAATLAASLALVGSACGSGSDSTSQAATSETAASVGASSDSPVAALNGITTVDGSNFDASALSNSDVLLWFWAPW